MAKHETEKRSTRIIIKFMPSLKKLAEERARKEGRSLSNYIEQLVKRDLEDNEEIALLWCREEYRDKAGVGTVKFFESKEIALEEAEREWNGLTEADKASYKKDAEGMFVVHSKWAKVEDGSVALAGDGYNGLDDPVEEAKNFLE